MPQNTVETHDDIHHTFDDDFQDGHADDTVIINDDDSGDTEEYGKKVQKRINKLVSERNIERQQREELAAELEAKNQRLAELEQHVSKATDDNLQAEIAQRRAKKTELMEIGEFEQAAEIDDEIMDLKLRQRDSRQPQRTAPKQEQGRTTETATETVAEIPAAQKQWLVENDWFYNPAKAELKAKADKTYLALVDEGFDPNDEDTYVELNKRLSVKRQAPPPTIAPDRGNATGDARSVKFTAEDSAKMRRWGMDPNDVNARKEYLRNK